MANRTSYFFYAPTWDYPPNGPIKLGNVLTSLKKPERPLCTAAPLADADVFSSEKTQVEFSRDKLNSGQFSILTKFLSFLGVGVDVGVSWDVSEGEAFSFDRIETTQFFPNKDYLQRCIEAEPVRRYLDKSRYRKPIYIITGIKTVTGAKAKSFKSRGIGGSLSTEVDGTVWSGGALPISSGPTTEVNHGRNTDMSWEGSSDFVFAFRVRKVLVEKKTGVVSKDEDYKRGAMLERVHGILEVPVLSILVEMDPDVGQEGFTREELMEGDVPVICAVPHHGQVERTKSR
ncbi:hypothetical protein F4813DRAFT_388475 [Daldinia decipiens]|uniref:uncharacterized protein n=1 Tax=Daldinia decipiens TaxID=326647 RepID=UPI0020C20038|nr:uncharacterized protein F4813DRAFT_388475 [Daldinia decipiens]KAI1658709.1 hypothetical protein F4813DRAFT_388475 [Daldinia decipiens]